MYLGIRDEPPSALVGDDQKIADHHQNFPFEPILSMLRGSTARRVGFVSSMKLSAGTMAALGGHMIHCAGQPIMMDAVCKSAIALGADSASTLTDRFEAAKPSARGGIIRRLSSFER